jgi:hypothetical protein
MNNDVSKILAYEYGYLDAKLKLEYSPRPVKYKEEYHKGYKSFLGSILQSKNEIPVGSYTDKQNWGWY